VAQRPDTDFTRFVQAIAKRHPTLPAALAHRLARAYGSRIDKLLTPEANALGAEVVPGLHEGELRYLHAHEWARSADDVLWRRSKLGLHLSAEQRQAVADWCAKHWPDSGSSTANAPRPTESSWS